MTPTMPQTDPHDLPGGDGHASLDPPAAPRRKPLVPPHIAWPAFVVCLLLLGIGSAFEALFAARSDGGAKIVENYYDEAVGYDETRAAQAASNALGWTAGVSVGACEGGLCPVEVTVQDRDGTPVEGLTGVVRASRPQDASAVARLPLSAEGTPGVYRQMMPISTAGLWDFAIEAQRGDDRFLTTLRSDLSR
jgi:nitrogen fixation protein FixH